MTDKQEQDTAGSAHLMEIDADKIAKAIVLAACELDEMPSPDDADTLLITVQDLEAVAHRHITAAIERAALAVASRPQFLPTEDGEFNGNDQPDAWLPMQTAPRDGTVILLSGGAYGGYPFSGKWEQGPFANTDRPWLNVITDSRLYEHVPKKWMAIPV